MSMQSHLAELERKHQALETELADALAKADHAMYARKAARRRTRLPES